MTDRYTFLYFLAVKYDNGEGEYSKDEEKALEFFKKFLTHPSVEGIMVDKSFDYSSVSPIYSQKVHALHRISVLEKKFLSEEEKKKIQESLGCIKQQLKKLFEEQQKIRKERRDLIVQGKTLDYIMKKFGPQMLDIEERRKRLKTY